MQRLVVLAVVAATTIFVIQRDEKESAPATREDEHVAHWSYEPGTHATVELPVKFGDRIFTTGQNTGVFYYEGSLTTPPCTEGV